MSNDRVEYLRKGIQSLNKLSLLYVGLFIMGIVGFLFFLTIYLITFNIPVFDDIPFFTYKKAAAAMALLFVIVVLLTIISYCFEMKKCKLIVSKLDDSEYLTEENAFTIARIDLIYHFFSYVGISIIIFLFIFGLDVVMHYIFLLGAETLVYMGLLAILKTKLDFMKIILLSKLVSIIAPIVAASMAIIQIFCF